MFENPRRGRQARNFTTNVPKILDIKSSSEQIFFRKLSLGAPVICVVRDCAHTLGGSLLKCSAIGIGFNGAETELHAF